MLYRKLYTPRQRRKLYGIFLFNEVKANDIMVENLSLTLKKYEEFKQGIQVLRKDRILRKYSHIG